MAKTSISVKRSRESIRDELFIRADKQADKGNFKSAFRLFLAAAKAGDTSCHINLGNYYDQGTGVKRNRSAAMYWYKRAYRRGEACAAHNIGVMWRNERKYRRAVEWFRRAVKLGHPEANLEIAKYYLEVEKSPVDAAPYLEKVCDATWVTESGLEEARRLLRRLKRRTKRT